jgi:hypothetical protein
VDDLISVMTPASHKQFLGLCFKEALDSKICGSQSFQTNYRNFRDASTEKTTGVASPEPFLPFQHPSRSVWNRKKCELQTNIDTGTQHPAQRLERIFTSIYAEMSKMQHQQDEAIVMLRNCDAILRKQATDKAGLEKQNRWLVERIKIAHQEACDLEFKNRELEYQLAKERQDRPEQSATKQS